MADLSVTPVGDQIQPVKGMSLSDVVNIANGVNTYKQGKIALSLEEQKQKERMEVQKFLSNPENFQTGGRIDIDKMNAELPKIAPITAPEWIGKMTTLGNAQTNAIQAKQNLNQSQLELIGSTIGAIGRSPNPTKDTLRNGFDLLKQKNPDNKDFSKLIDSYKTVLEQMPENTDFKKWAISGANTLLTPEQQQAAFAPKPGVIDTGASIYPTVTQPSVTGENPSVQVGNTPLVNNQLPPNAREVPTGFTDVNNKQIINVFDANGKFLGTRAGTGTPTPEQLPGGDGNNQGDVTPVVTLPPGQTTKTLDAANELRTKTGTDTKDIQNQIFNYNQILKLADKAWTGQGSEALAALGSTIGLQWTNLDNNATNLQDLGHYMSLQTKELAEGVGGTDAARGIAGQIAGTKQWTAQSIKNTARVNRALATSKLLFNQGLQSAFNKTKDPYSAVEFQNKWPSIIDINAIRLYDALKNNDVEGKNQIIEGVGGVDSEGYKKLMENAKKIQKMIKGQ